MLRLTTVLRAAATAILVCATLVAHVAGAVARTSPRGQSAGPAYVTDPASLVNPFIGTTNGGNTFPGADTPFGMMQWTPNTPSRPAGGGYAYGDSSIIGYSLNALDGPGCAALDDVPVLPTTGAIPADPTSATSPLDHAQETATPGYYSLDSGGITTRLTTATRSGIGTFSFPASASTGNLLFKLSDSGAADTATHFQVVGPREVQGSVTSGDFCDKTDNQYTLHFDVRFDAPIAADGTWTNPTAGSQAGVSVARERPARAGRGAPVTGADGAWVSFDTAHSSTITAKVGISYVSNADAALNLHREISGWDLAGVRTAAHDAWNAALGRIQVAGGTPTQQATFYTALYHSLLHPNVFSDVNGSYMGFDGQVHTTSPAHPVYANYSGWDVYRSQSQMEAMLFPQTMSDTVRSMLDDFRQTGQLPKWSENNGESYEVLGDPADSIIADAYAFGARDFDVRGALADMETEAQVPGPVRPGLAQYLSDGYVPSDGSYACCDYHDPVATTEEYDAADNSIAEFAAALGDPSTAQSFAARANDWQNVFDPATGFVQEKLSNGAFQSGFSPTADTGFEEADSYVYRTQLPFDVAGVAAALGGRAQLATALDGLTQSVTAMSPTELQLSNEPSLDIPWEYDYVGEPDRTEAVVRSAEDQLYLDAPDGLAGNDDLGELSNWLVWAGIGFYPETPGSATVALGSPEFPAVAIHLGDGQTITETAPQAADDAPYVESMQLDGRSWNDADLPASLFSRGGTIDWTLGTQANPSFAATPAAAPPSNQTGLASALGWVQGPGGSPLQTLNPGTATTLTLGAQSLSSAPQTVHWTASATPGSGLVISPASGSMTVGAEARTSLPVVVSAPAGAPDGDDVVTFTLTSATGTPLPPVAESVGVASAGDLEPYADDVGISSDDDESPADFDGDGNSYSQQALAAQGVAAGGAIAAADGIHYTFPALATPSQPDDVVADGQTIPLPSLAGETTLGILGSATDGPSTATVTITYTDGSTSTAPLTLADWTLNGGTGSVPATDTTVATTAYRNETIGKTSSTGADLFSATLPITAGKTVASVTLPAAADQGVLHVFAIGSNAGPLTH